MFVSHDIIHIHNNVLWDWQYSKKYSHTFPILSMNVRNIIQNIVNCNGYEQCYAWLHWAKKNKIIVGCFYPITWIWACWPYSNIIEGPATMNEYSTQKKLTFDEGDTQFILSQTFQYAIIYTTLDVLDA